MVRHTYPALLKALSCHKLTWTRLLRLLVSISHSPSVSSQIAELRRLLVGNSPDLDGSWAKAAKGELPLVVAVDKVRRLRPFFQPSV